MQRITEGLVTLHFSSGWTVVKWDEHPVHVSLSGRGFKGVDVVGLSPEGPHLIELKDYRSTGEGPPTELPEAIDKKVRGSLLALLWG